MTAEDEERFEYVRAIVDCGTLRWEYKLIDSFHTGRMEHDEDVTEWTEQDIIDLTCRMLYVPDDNRDVVRVEYA
jgi:hypothetical protein